MRAFLYDIVRHLGIAIIASSTNPRSISRYHVIDIIPIPVPKVFMPTCNAEFQPISITPVLTRLIEKDVVREHLYPALLSPLPDLTFTDQFAFRLSGSTTAALIHLLRTITELLSVNPYVIVTALDFSKAFNTVRHSSLLQKFAKLDFRTTYITGWWTILKAFTAPTTKDKNRSYWTSLPASSRAQRWNGCLHCQCRRHASRHAWKQDV